MKVSDCALDATSQFGKLFGWLSVTTFHKYNCQTNALTIVHINAKPWHFNKKEGKYFYRVKRIK